MTQIVEDFEAGLQTLLVTAGQQIRIRYFNVGFDSDYYDDDVSLTIAGTDYWGSGVILPISNARGSSDAVLLEQGKILMDDTKIYVGGTVSTSGVIKIGIGSPEVNTEQFSLLAEGVKKWDVYGIPIVKKLFVRKLLTGSLIGEVAAP